jgi:hypothetical protein
VAFFPNRKLIDCTAFTSIIFLCFSEGSRISLQPKQTDNKNKVMNQIIQIQSTTDKEVRPFFSKFFSPLRNTFVIFWNVNKWRSDLSVVIFLFSNYYLPDESTNGGLLPELESIKQ